MLLKNKILSLLLIIFIKFTIEKEEEKTKTCENNKNDEFKLLYDNYFLNHQEKSSFNNFEFEINEKVIEFIKDNNIITYPRSTFRGNLQGNFLHFMHLIYEKKLPLYFTLDQIIYPYIEITKNIIEKIIEDGLFDIFDNFLKNIIDFGLNNNFDKKIITYFSIGYKFLNKENRIENEEIISEIINNILNISNINDNKNNYYYNFTFLEFERNINKLNFMMINPLFNKNTKTKNLFYCITFFQNFVFNIRNELFTIYSIGKLIYQSGQANIYKEIKKYFKYIFNEEENIINPLEIYEYININYENKKTKDEINFNLYYKIKDNINKNYSLSFMSNYSINDEKYENEFNYQKNSKISLFSYSYNIEQWINYKLLSINKKRLFPSFYEYITIVHNGNKMKNLIFKRYHYGNETKNKTKGNKNKMLKFRDGINMEKEFNEVKSIIDKSLKDENEKWINSYENSFNYLLNIIGHSKDELYKENNENENNKIKKFGFESKIFNTLIGSYIHFKKDILLFEQLTKFNYAENGAFVDVYYENNIIFYEELSKITLIFKNYSMNIVKNIQNIEIKKNLTNNLEHKLNKLFLAYENIKKMISYQNNNIFNDEREKIKDKMFYYDKEKKIYEGWYVDLYKKNNEKDAYYNLNIYAYNYYISEPINELKYDGAIIYGAMNYPEFGLIGIEDKINQTKKIYIMSFYSGNEYPHGWSDEIDFDSLKKIIIKR